MALGPYEHRDYIGNIIKSLYQLLTQAGVVRVSREECAAVL